MVAQADRIRDRDPRGALQLGVAATDLDDSPQSWAGLPQTLTSTSRFRTLRTHAGAVPAIAYASDGRTLASVGEDGAVTGGTWGIGTSPGRLRQPLTGQTGSIDRRRSPRTGAPWPPPADGPSFCGM